MKPIVRLAALVGTLALSIGIADAAPERHTDVEVRMHMELQQAFMLGRIDDLERWTNAYRTTRSRMPNGYWHLHWFYKLVRDFPTYGDDEASLVKWRELTDRWQKAYPASPTPAILLATRYDKTAWKARGSGSAHKVWRDDWATFKRLLGEARDILNTAKGWASIDPEWYARRAQIALALGEGDAEFMVIIDEGLAREPTYYKLYNVPFYYFGPKWHGSYALAERWARAAADRARPTEGDSVYARIYALAGETTDPELLLHQHKIDWPRMKRSSLELLAKYPQLELANPLLGLSCAARDGEQIKAIWKLLAVTLPGVDPEAIDPPRYCRWDSGPTREEQRSAVASDPLAGVPADRYDAIRKQISN